MTDAPGPLQRYRSLVADGAIRRDASQAAAVEKLELLHRRLERSAKPKGVFGLFGFTSRGEEEVDARQGLYLYGGVGRGKSMLMDLFFETAPVSKKRRVHFHAFMQETHARLNAKRAKGTADLIPPIVAEIASETRLLCFDEMQVTDITDAMLLGRLFDGLFDEEVVVVATSNRHPTDLYKDGLNRELFLPFIDRICGTLDIHHLDGPTDFRLARLQGVAVYHAPLGPEADAAMDAAFAELTAGRTPRPLDIGVGGRTVRLPAYADGVGRATFEDLCAAPLGPADFLAIAGSLRTLCLDRVPILSPANNNEAKRFVTLVDALYEARAALVCSAAAEPDALYPDGAGAFEFQRTASRLEEMRSDDWPPEA